jgi:uncharacterized protein HemX
MGGGRRLSACVMLLALGAALASCSRATPLCDYGDELVKSAQPAAAADAYATAARSDEGDCADDGLDRVAELRARAGTFNAKGRAAARAGQVPAAQASFRAALAIDRDDGTATAELQRLSRTSPAPTPTASTVLISGPPGRDAGQGLAWFALIVAVAAVAAFGALWRLQRRQTFDAQLATVREEAETQQQGLADLVAELDTLRKRLDGEASAASSRTDEVRRAVEEFRAQVLRLIEAGRAPAADVDEWFASEEER